MADLSKATPRPWDLHTYRISAPYTTNKGIGKRTYQQPVVVARANQKYRNPAEDEANVELCFKAVNFTDRILPLLRELLHQGELEDEQLEEIEAALEEFDEEL